MKNFLNEFKAFAMKGSVIDLAVGIVIGTAFAAITKSLVDNVIMPLVGIAMRGIDFTTLSFWLGDAQIQYGQLIQAIVNFVIIAFALFLVIKAMNVSKEKLTKKEKKEMKEVQADPVLSKDQELLVEIRDLLKKMK